MTIIKDESLGQYTLPVGELIKAVTDADMQEDSTLEPGDLKRVGVSIVSSYEFMRSIRSI